MQEGGAVWKQYVMNKYEVLGVVGEGKWLAHPPPPPDRNVIVAVYCNFTNIDIICIGNMLLCQLLKGRPWYNGSVIDCKSTFQVIDPEPGA